MKMIELKKINIIISCLLLLFLSSCKTNKSIKKRFIQGVVVYSLEKNYDSTFCLRNKYLVSNDSIFYFNSNKYIDSLGNITISPFELTKQDSVYNLDYSNLIDKKLISNFIRIGNKNIYNRDDNYYILFEIEAFVNYYSLTSEDIPDVYIDEVKRFGSRNIIHLDSLVKTKKLNKKSNLTLKINKIDSVVISCELIENP